jgi:hypothetical protein
MLCNCLIYRGPAGHDPDSYHKFLNFGMIFKKNEMKLQERFHSILEICNHFLN